jgi:hypothetical protein
MFCNVWLTHSTCPLLCREYGVVVVLSIPRILHTSTKTSPVNSRPLSWCSTRGHPNFVTHVVTNDCATTVVFLVAIASTSTHFEKQSCITTRYFFPRLDGGRGPIKSIATLSLSRGSYSLLFQSLFPFSGTWLH